MTKRIFPINDWAPVQEALFSETPSTRQIGESGVDQQMSQPDFDECLHSQHRSRRSMSHSFPWRHRPKSLVFNADDDLSARLRDLSFNPSTTGHSGPSTSHGHSHSHSLSVTAPRSETSGSIRGILRRASTSLKGMVQRRAATASATPVFEERSPLRPGTAHSTWHRLRQAASFRHSRSFYGGDLTSDASHTATHSSLQVPLPVPGIGGEPPIIPHHTGAAAKAAAALQNEYMLLNERQNRPRLQGSFQNKWLAAGDDCSTDHESGIGITVASSESEVDISGVESLSLDQQESSISRKDFVSELPAELAIQILSYLDASGLASSSRVSRNWKAAIDNQHIWRESFLREKTGTYATSGPVRPGHGLGVPTVHPTNDWRQIYRVRDELDKKWKAGKARCVYLHGHLDSIYCLQFDEFKIITGSRDKTVRIWDMHTFQCRLIIGPPEVLNDIGLLVDDKRMPVHYAINDQNHAFAASMPALVSFPTHHKASILCLQYDDRILVTGSSDASCIVYNVRSGYRPVRRLRHHTAAVLDLAFDSKHIVTCSKDVSICVWDRATGNLLRQLRGHSGPVNAVQMRGNTIVSCSGDFRVKLWNIDTGKNIREFAGHTKGLACSQFSEDGRYIASAGNDKVIRIWDANTGECLQEMTGHKGLVRSLHIDSISGRLISGSYDTDIKVFDIESGAELLKFKNWHASWVLSAKSDYRRIISTGQDPRILIMDFGGDVRGIDLLESRHGQDVDGGYI